ncbi:sensor histidine kinase [Chengkuizengella axinellae]|uniref:histidine kinase n=1 Tax=Chengkuizengella axinellae TaxID=3064388 RepID=A0ABT9J328_9BACL|nr:HAMP domain-containing sensor histidine kinase [Chengkuizengella sp. 2205SS18-9]MDP5276022.1 HAMP domain-containing sensor histidine kinase [Chengkuizengella sp. 2205SS18-9]
MKLKFHIPLLFLIIEIIFFFLALVYMRVDVRDKLAFEFDESNEQFIQRHEEVIKEVENLYPDQQRIQNYLYQLANQEQWIIKINDPTFEKVLFEFNNLDTELFTKESWLPVKSPQDDNIVLFISIQRKLDEFIEVSYQFAIDLFIFVVITHFMIFLLLTLYFHEKITGPITKLIHRFKKVNLHRKIPSEEVSRKDEIGELYQRFNELETRLQSIYGEQIDMVTSIAHDLKTPLTSINGFLEVVISSNMQSKEQKDEYIKLVQKKALFMTELVNQFSDFSRSEIALQEMERGIVPLKPFFESIGEEYEAELLGMDYTFRWKHDFSEELNIIGNEKFLRRLFANLISNSIRYANNEELKVSMIGTVKENSIMITIEDNGIGVSESDLPYLFQKFYTVDKSRQREKGGTGLGLAIAKSIVEGHGGKVVAYQSEKLGGLGIKIILPLDS